MPLQYSRNSTDKKPKDGYSANRVSGKDYADVRANQAQTQKEEFELAEVVTVIRSSDHPDHKTNEDIGRAKVRRLYSEFDQDKKALGYATPMNGKFKTYPLEHELVLVSQFNRKSFYFRIANWKSNPHQNIAPEISVNKIETGSGGGGSYGDASSGISQSGGESEINVEDDKFEVKDTIKPLRHRAGDATIEGRFGNSIRIGRDGKQNPIMQLRVGQRDEVESSEYLTPFFEDINKDPTSIYLTDEATEFPLGPEEVSAELEPTTIDFEDHLFSAEETPDAYNNAQILMATNRVVMNAKERQIMGFAKKDINWTTLANFTVDAKKRIKTLSKSGHLHITESYFDVLSEGNIHLATEDEKEPVARGQQTHDRLIKTLQTLQIETHPTPCGPSGPPNQAGTYAQIEQKVRETVRSEKIFVDNVGEKVKRSMSPASE